MDIAGGDHEDGCFQGSARCVFQFESRMIGMPSIWLLQSMMICFAWCSSDADLAQSMMLCSMRLQSRRFDFSKGACIGAGRGIGVAFEAMYCEPAAH